MNFTCDGNNRFRVYYGEYVSGDQRVRPGEEGIMPVDEQPDTVYLLERLGAASGAKYAGDTLEFREHGDQPMLRRDGQKLYSGCGIVG